MNRVFLMIRFLLLFPLILRPILGLLWKIGRGKQSQNWTKSRAFVGIALFLFSPLLAKPLEVEVTAPSAILMNGKTGKVLFEKQAHNPLYPASITKIATALFILDHKKPSLEEMIVVSDEAMKMKPSKNKEASLGHWLEMDGTKMGIKKGEVLSFEALLHGLLLVSGNDAANAMASALAPSIPEFVDEMNRYVKGLGCQNTQFKNPHGLHHPEHFTTAYDICLIAKKALGLPKFREIFSKVSYKKPKTNKQGAEEIIQTNALLKPGKYFYEKAIGAKNGFTSHALSTFVGAAEHEGRVLIAALLGCKNKNDRYQDAVKLFEAAFQEQPEKKRLFTAERLFTREIEGAKGALQARLLKDLEIVYFPSEEPECRAFIEWDPVKLPVGKGQKVGVIEIKDERGEVVQKAEIVAKEELKATFFFSLKEAVKNLFR